MTPRLPLLLLQSCRCRCRWYDLLLISGIGVVVGLLGLLYIWHWGSWLLGFDKPHPRAWMHPYLIIGFPILGVSYLLIRLNRVMVGLLAIVCFLLSLLVSFTHPLLGVILLLAGTRLMWITNGVAKNVNASVRPKTAPNAVKTRKIVIIIVALVVGVLILPLKELLQEGRVSTIILGSSIGALILGLIIVGLVICRHTHKEQSSSSPPSLP